MHGRDLLRSKRIDNFPVKPDGTEHGMIHEKTEKFRVQRLGIDNVKNIVFGKVICFPKFQCYIMRNKFTDGIKSFAIQFLKVLSLILFKRGQSSDGIISDIRSILTTFLLIDLKVGHYLLERQFERISDVVEKRSKSPILQESICEFIRLIYSSVFIFTIRLKC